MVFLKNIEAKGFKSFAEKTRIEFNKGLTAVVGPNGSGKSNIIDAIRFVLGETSARSIRGSKMEDVIFNGTVKRSAENSATVTLSLDNSDGVLPVNEDTVKVTRILYRSGESEYYLNGGRVRLKEITELFMDQGIGKSAYNIISQGEVDDILSAKPEDRRAVIEEAAGVVKYKHRKRESERKLEDTKQNLDRVHDIISELESRNTQLEMESKVAEEYLALMEEMKSSDIEVSVYDIETFLEEENTLNTKYKSSERLLEERKNHVSLLDVEIENLRDSREAVAQKERNHNEKIVELTRDLEIVNGKMALFEERKTSRGQLSMDLQMEKEKVESRVCEEKGLLSEKTNFVETLLFEEKSLKTEIQSIRKNIERLTSQDDVSIEDLKDRYYALMVEKTNLENKEAQQNESKNRMDASENDKRERKEALYLELKELNKNIEILLEKEVTSSRALNEARDKYRELKSEYNEKNSEYDRLSESYQKAESLIKQESSRLDVLINMQENFQGYYPGVRTVLKNKNKLNGIVGAVGELIDVEEKYVTALDTALGAGSQNIVVKTDQDAKHAIQFLKRERHGFATFLPLSTIVERHLPHDVLDTLRKTTVNHKILSKIVNVDKKLMRLVNHLINTTIVVDTLDEGVKLANEISYRARIVTLEGDTITPGGAMSGGSKTRQNSVLKMKQDVVDGKERLVSYKKSTKDLSSKLEEIKETIADLIVELKRQEARGVETSEENEEINRELERLRYSYSLKNETYESLVSELDSLDSSSDFEDYAILIKEKELEITELSNEIALLSDKTLNQEERLLREKEELHLKRRDLSKLETTINYEKERLISIESTIDEFESEINSLNERIKMTENENIELDISALIEDKERLSKGLNELSQVTESLATELTELSESYKESIVLRQSHLADIENLQIELREIHGKREKISTHLSQKIDYLSEMYALTFERAKALYNNFEDIEEKRQRISLNKRSIEELGNVNLGAIDEYKRVHERYIYLKEQEDDLLEARRTLLSVIDEMDKEVTERFKETFNSVSKQFTEVFKEMFGGGHAELRLLDDDDYLNSGLEIIAQPPGKKLTQMSLMSGGERALTAISLLFSVLKVKGSPFIILDEVEAALDESNVIRYADYLRGLSRDTQFIVITHRKGTMEKSDRLFGVTMQERGISELISVDLKNYLEPNEGEINNESV
ncbi:chromosome segregation protein SMC [Phocicoccus pinnipedialis]|uniref:Chromosome partition protein Smc n=1 Tax=Phocicoccus pinnipedialis TaxID=110845 RepID=A0A6V7RG86_9BACL|nr:chromosome segregation protein SMC [Jeotgalicoccus pinnipedialis]MBP1939090.1 chromosome segregation protein [Jeotgalicoccus pinnipedialis]CAD2076850.1 Chromosome partition protein Smc [Jeotgalicoccus pinnipedialis]